MSRLVPAVTRALDILELFLSDHDTLSAPEIVAALQLPRTTVHELISTLVARRYLTPADGGRYRLGLRTHQLGSRYADQLDLVTEGERAARRISLQCRETVHVAVLEETSVIYIAKVDSTHTVRMVSAPGRRLPAHCTAVGKILLASLPKPELQQLFPQDRPLKAMTPNSITDPATLLTELAETHRRGIAIEERESNPDVSCLAAPVHDRSGNVVAAMSISLPSIRWNAERRTELEKLIALGAAELSEHLGFRSTSA
ncbi:IclR family transcriptional regulator [Nocardia salmonicida]|uniref:IclR family transcriptional regulator n=1 Tax=Nocardia salmonicida TaxID=53431 RepID=UPI0007A3EEAA|nr:IclR family transcriptional regulator [Nocardia salmonicida]